MWIFHLLFKQLLDFKHLVPTVQSKGESLTVYVYMQRRDSECIRRGRSKRRLMDGVEEDVQFGCERRGRRQRQRGEKEAPDWLRLPLNITREKRVQKSF